MDTRAMTTQYRMNQWTQIIQERKSAGLSITEFCQTRGISPNTYFYWQRKIRESACEHLALHHPCFTEVAISEPQTAVLDQICVSVGEIEIKLNNTYPPEKLAALVRELVRP